MVAIRGGALLERRLAQLARRVSRPGTLRVGFLAGATYPDGKSVAMIGAIQNWGAPGAGIPPRPFFSNMVADKSGGWGGDTAVALRREDYDATRALNIVGMNIEGQLRQSIKDTNAPPLAASTIAKRMARMSPSQILRANAKAQKTGKPASYAKPLVDTGHMLNSIDHEVV